LAARRLFASSLAHSVPLVSGLALRPKYRITVAALSAAYLKAFERRKEGEEEDETMSVWNFAPRGEAERLAR
jgi:hypothetical protein